MNAATEMRLKRERRGDEETKRRRDEETKMKQSQQQLDEKMKSEKDVEMVALLYLRDDTTLLSR